MEMAGTQILHIKIEVSDTIRHNRLPIWKYLCIIFYGYDPCPTYRGSIFPHKLYPMHAQCSNYGSN